MLKELLRTKEIDKEIENLGVKELDEVLCAFIVEVKQKDGGEYEPTTLRLFISSFDRYLRKKGYPSTNIDGQEFRKARETLAAKQKELKKAGKGSKTKAARALTDNEVEALQQKPSRSFVSGVLEQHPALWPERMPRAQRYDKGVARGVLGCP